MYIGENLLIPVFILHGFSKMSGVAEGMRLTSKQLVLNGAVRLKVQLRVELFRKDLNRRRGIGCSSIKWGSKKKNRKPRSIWFLDLEALWKFYWVVHNNVLIYDTL